MKKFYTEKVENNFIFEGDELHHFNVLRCAVGEQIVCLCRDGYDYLCEVTEVSKKRAMAKIVEIKQNEKNPKVNITVFQGLVKGDKIDLIVQKLTELGISSLYTFESEFTVAKANGNKIDRLNRVSEEACKQCGRSVPLNIYDTIKFKAMIEKLNDYDLVLFANEKNRVRDFKEFSVKKNIAIVVGSEGGFSDGEIEAIYNSGAINFGLGERILRAETACIALASIIGYMVEV